MHCRDKSKFCCNGIYRMQSYKYALNKTFKRKKTGMVIKLESQYFWQSNNEIISKSIPDVYLNPYMGSCNCTKYT